VCDVTVAGASVCITWYKDDVGAPRRRHVRQCVPRGRGRQIASQVSYQLAVYLSSTFL